ncbi:Hypothetical protein R9X50_00361800 [Acrodontium crateriforme]|uniref:Molybdopterin synthase sulfur carrier subunit n=1 Tax=Acrodontium crateriforme TaxID=150365 RepID=A0AAQ3M625_9PEZI|nr:Hypothetical protein R9X50_00361800 [Acrodontium crateriforme]
MSVPKAPSGHFTLLYFAAATSFTQKQYDFIPAPLSIEQLHTTLETKYPGISERILKSSALTINLDYVDVEQELAKGIDGMQIQPRDEVAVIPPVSSG